MSTEQNKAVARRLIEEMIGQGNMSVADEIVALDYVGHPTPPGVPAGREGLKIVVTMYRSAFPDLKTTIHDLIAEGDKVVIHMTHSATNTGAFMGIPATGKSASFGEIAILRFAESKIVEYWGQTDMMGMMQQLGIIPAPGQSGN